MSRSDRSARCTSFAATREVEYPLRLADDRAYRVLGIRVVGPRVPPSATRSVRARAAAHLNLNSVWLHNSLRGGVALGIAVLVAELSGVEHTFWVVLGAFTILRSNVVSTGQNAANVMLGTVIGFVIGCSLTQLIGTNDAVLWVLLPFTVLVAGVAPTFSFAAA
jgi:uncharacterized membrane protein YccC